MFIDVVPNGRSASAVLLRESYREGSKVRKRTLANLSKLPASVVDGLRVLLQGCTAIARPEEVFEIQRSLPHGHVAAVIGVMRKLDLPRLLSRTVFARAGLGPGVDRQSHHRAGLQTGDRPGAVAGDGEFQPGTGAGSGCHRGTGDLRRA